VSFSVEPDALRVAAKAHEQSVGHLVVASAYNTTHSQFEWYEVGLIAGANADHRNLVELLQQRLAQAAELLSRSAQELAKAGDAYERIDRRSAAEIDSAYPASERPDARVWHGR
jgi:ATP-dependent protease HslVU (ClpYQ) peptidase subunit